MKITILVLVAFLAYAYARPEEPKKVADEVAPLKKDDAALKPANDGTISFKDSNNGPNDDPAEGEEGDEEGGEEGDGKGGLENRFGFFGNI